MSMLFNLCECPLKMKTLLKLAQRVSPQMPIKQQENTISCLFHLSRKILFPCPIALSLCRVVNLKENQMDIITLEESELIETANVVNLLLRY